MLLWEILDKSSPKIKTTSKPVSDLLPPNTHKVVGIGAQALAYLHHKYPTKIIKTIQVYGDSDPSYQFLRLVLKHQDNPYFPKIYNVKMYPTKEANYRTRGIDFDEMDPTGVFSPPPSQLDYTIYVVMEKLSNLSQITEQDLRMFGIPKVGSGKVDLQFRRAFKDRYLRSVMINNVKDPFLRQALRLLEPLFNHFEPDMHKNNIMLRGTHWVFVDPISHNVDSSS
jgi:hypothetical protein